MHTTEHDEEFAGPFEGHRGRWQERMAMHARMHGGPGRGPRGPRIVVPGFGPGFGPGGPRGPFRGFGGPGFGRGHKAGRGDVRLAVLSLIAEQPLHGYQIIQQIAERSGGVWRPSAGSIYPMLQQLTDEGLIRVEESDGRRVFHLTEAGQTYVQEHGAELAAVWDAINEAPDDGRRELGELAATVGMATMQVAQAGTAAQIAAARQVLAATRRQLYRILAEDESTGETTDTGESDETHL